MSKMLLNVEGVGKRYAVYGSNLERFANWFGARIAPASEFWAVKDMSFTVNSGESLALIGQNGAGKSTLLKLITGTVRPSRGTIGIDGTISAILELGLGFNMEFTGRQNVFHAGGLMGLSHPDLVRLMPEIESFAEIGEFFDQPMRTYSSGMQARLAFALATAKRPDILIVDEVLSVGDSYFQHKSFDRIRSFKEAGTSIILVTHSMGDVRALCDRVLLIDQGAVLKDGAPDEVVDYYNALVAIKENQKLTVEQRREKSGWLLTRSGSLEIAAESVDLLDAETLEPIATARVGQCLLLRLVARAKTDLETLVLGYMLRDRTGHILWGTNTWHTGQILRDIKAGEAITYDLIFTCSLGPGSYSFSPALVNSDTHLDKNFEWQDNAVVFDVVNINKKFFIGSVELDGEFSFKREGAAG